jgi:hypothetical protein
LGTFWERAAATITTAIPMTAIPAWDAAVDEARGHYCRAIGEHARAAELFRSATKRFTDVGQPLDAARCAASITG